MKLRRAQAVACTTLLFSLPFCYGQTAPAPAASDATFRAGAQEVILDVVVRDKKGQRVTDVQPSDLEVYDNGVRRQITSFKLVEGGSTAITAEEKSGSTAVTAAEPERKKHVNPLAQVRLVTLIFNRLDLNSRTLARKASLDLLKNEFPENVFMSVLALDDGVHALQAFTNDRDLLRKAVEHATSGAYTEFISDSKRIEEDMKSQLGPAQAGESLGEQVQGMSDATGGSGGKGPTGDPAGAAMRSDLEAYLTRIVRIEWPAQIAGRAVTPADLLFGKYLLLRKGKRNYALVRFE